MAETIILEGTKVKVTGGDGADVHTQIDKLVTTLGQATVQGLDEEALADHLKWKVKCGNVALCIVELKPQLRRLQWLAANSPDSYGPGAVYEERRLATPYVVLKVPFVDGKIIERVELFYRNQPLRNLDDSDLYWCNLLNVSPRSHGCLAWMCTQFLKRERCGPGITAGLDALVHHLFGGGFNKSAEHYEKNSGFLQAQKDQIDARVTDVQRWEEESIRDPRFILDIAWKPADINVRTLLENELKHLGVVRDLASVPEIVNALLSQANGTKKSPQKGS